MEEARKRKEAEHIEEVSPNSEEIKEKPNTIPLQHSPSSKKVKSEKQEQSDASEWKEKVGRKKHTVKHQKHQSHPTANKKRIIKERQKPMNKKDNSNRASPTNEHKNSVDINKNSSQPATSQKRKKGDSEIQDDSLSEKKSLRLQSDTSTPEELPKDKVLTVEGKRKESSDIQETGTKKQKPNDSPTLTTSPPSSSPTTSPKITQLANILSQNSTQNQLLKQLIESKDYETSQLLTTLILLNLSTELLYVKSEHAGIKEELGSIRTLLENLVLNQAKPNNTPPS